jgi:hypothetical protein
MTSRISIPAWGCTPNPDEKGTESILGELAPWLGVEGCTPNPDEKGTERSKYQHYYKSEPPVALLTPTKRGLKVLTRLSLPPLEKVALLTPTKRGLKV